MDIAIEKTTRFSNLTGLVRHLRSKPGSTASRASKHCIVDLKRKIEACPLRDIFVTSDHPAGTLLEIGKLSLIYEKQIMYLWLRSTQDGISVRHGMTPMQSRIIEEMLTEIVRKRSEGEYELGDLYFDHRYHIHQVTG